jgi:carbon storage regulator
MVIFSRGLNQKIRIGDDIVIIIVDIDRGKVRLGIDHPKDCAVHRQEVYDALYRKQPIPPLAPTPLPEPEAPPGPTLAPEPTPAPESEAPVSFTDQAMQAFSRKLQEGVRKKRLGKKAMEFAEKALSEVLRECQSASLVRIPLT